MTQNCMQSVRLFLYKKRKRLNWLAYLFKSLFYFCFLSLSFSHVNHFQSNHHKMLWKSFWSVSVSIFYHGVKHVYIYFWKLVKLPWLVVQCSHLFFFSWFLNCFLNEKNSICFVNKRHLDSRSNGQGNEITQRKHNWSNPRTIVNIPIKCLCNLMHIYE